MQNVIGDPQASQLGCETRQGRQIGKQSGRQGRGSSEAGRDQASRNVSGPIWGSEGGDKLQRRKSLPAAIPRWWHLHLGG